MPLKRRTYPGSIFARNNKLHVKFKGKQYATGLLNNKLGLAQAEIYLENLWLKYNKFGDAKDEKPIYINDAFEAFLRTKVNCMNKTISNYKYAFKAVISDNYELTADRVEKDIQALMSNNKFCKVTKNTYLHYIQYFINFCISKKWIEYANFKKTYNIKNANEGADPWTEGEVQALINYFKAYDNEAEIALLIEFMTLTGARMVDALTLKPADITPDLIIFKNKKSKEPEPRPYTARAQEILRSLPVRQDRIFKWHYKSHSFLSKKLRIACRDLNINRNKKSFQEFRQVFRMRLLAAGMQPEYVMFMMRHSDFKTTMKFYTKYDVEIVRDLTEKATDNTA
jgi:integrase